MVEGLNRCTLYAFGFVMGFLFHAKYSVLYGTAMALANFDGMDTPSLPRHISIVHRFTDMWKFFDTGLYEFLFRYHLSLFLNSSTNLVLFADTFTRRSANVPRLWDAKQPAAPFASPSSSSGTACSDTCWSGRC